MDIQRDLIRTDKMVRQVMEANASPIHIEIPSMPDPFKDHLDMTALFNLSTYDWTKFFGAVLLCSFAAGMAWQGAIVGRDYLLPCP